MLKLTPDQIGTQWDFLKPAILNCMGDGIEEYPNQILEWLQSGRLECWVVLNNQETIVGITTTTVIRNEPYDHYSLLVFSFWSSSKISERKLWDQGLEHLKTYAQERGCVSLLAFTKDEGIANFLLKNGAVEKRCLNLHLKETTNGSSFIDNSIASINLRGTEHGD